jgi:RimJ/RimL family protein N-acetyltransferase
VGFATWRADDLALARSLWGDPEVTRFHGGAWSLEQIVARLFLEIESHRQWGVQYWLIFLRETGEHIGCCGFHARDPANGVWELGCHLRRGFWSRSLGREAAAAVIDYGFHTLGFKAIFACHHPSNTASRSFLQHLGFQYTHDELYPATQLIEPCYRLNPPRAPPSGNGVEMLSTEDLGVVGGRELREWLEVAYDGDFTEQNWAHTQGGLHALIRDGGGIICHAALVPRMIIVADRPLRAGYFEAVATRSDQRRRGHAIRVLGKLSEIIARDYDIGVLSTGLHSVYSPLGWERWRGASYAQMARERVRTTEDDNGLMVLRTSRTRLLDLSGDIVADCREGDVW